MMRYGDNLKTIIDDDFMPVVSVLDAEMVLSLSKRIRAIACDVLKVRSPIELIIKLRFLKGNFVPIFITTACRGRF